MKNNKSVLVIIMALAMAIGVNGQYCNSFAMTKDMVLSYQNFDSQGKETLRSQTTCLDVNTIGPLVRWPTSQGLDKFYGFLGGETNHWAPYIYVTCKPKKMNI